MDMVEAIAIALPMRKPRPVVIQCCNWRSGVGTNEIWTLSRARIRSHRSPIIQIRIAPVRDIENDIGDQRRRVIVGEVRIGRVSNSREEQGG
jgi:hypothetical protein